MNAELRERLGKAAYDGFSADMPEEHRIGWKDQHEFSRERYRREAEAVVKELAATLLPILIPTLLSPGEVARLLEEMLK